MERERLKAARYHKGWSQEQAAEQVGVSRNTLSRWEQGLTDPYPIHRQKLCAIYQATAAALNLDGAQHAKDQPVLSSTTLTTATDDMLAMLRKQTLALCFMKNVNNWPRRNTRYDELQSLLMQAIEEHKRVNSQPDHRVTRRDALRFLALLPIEMCELSASTTTHKYQAEEILPQCAAGILACWYMIRGHKVFIDYIVRSDELVAASNIVDSYIPTLKEVATSSPAQYRIAAANLLVQCFLLKASIARDIKGNRDGVAYMQQAELYSQVSNNVMLQVLTLRTLSSVHAYTNLWDRALQTAEQACHLMEQAHRNTVPPSVQSYVYSGLATYQAHMRQVQNTLISIGKAHETFARSSNESIPLWVDHSQVNLLLNDGVAHLQLGFCKDALASFSQTDRLSRGGIGNTEIWFHEAMAEVQRDDKPRDMDWCIDRWTKGIEGAKNLQSDQWFNEACMVYAAMRAAWPLEKRVKGLRELIVHW